MMLGDRRFIRRLEAQIHRLLEAVAGAQYWHDTWIARAQENAKAKVAAAEAGGVARVRSVREAQECRKAEVTSIYETRMQVARSEYEAQMEAARVEYERIRATFPGRLQAISDMTGLAGATWDDARWQVWKPEAVAEPPACARLGQLRLVDQWGELSLPALVPFVDGRTLLFRGAGKADARVVGAIESLLLRLLATVPPGKLRLTLIDPVGLGRNTSAFMELAEFDDALVTGQAWTEREHIDRVLRDLTEHMSNVIQRYFRKQFHSIEEYNREAGEVAEPYRVLVVLDFPANFTDDAARRLLSIASEGPSCGVYTIVAVDTARQPPHGFLLADLENTANMIEVQGERTLWNDEDFRDCTLLLDAPPPMERTTAMLKTIGAAAKATSTVEVPFERIAPAPETWWSTSSADGLHVPLGPAGALKRQYFDLGKETAQHVIIAGMPGSGKSTLLHTLITNLALTYSPAELELYLIDFKIGVEFKTYVTHELPHARVVAIASEREFGVSVLRGLDAELTRRGELFNSITATAVNDIRDYRRATGEVMPRCLLLVDEFQEFFTEEDQLGAQAAQLLDRLVRQGRAFGIHIVLGSQTLAGQYTLPRSTMNLIAIRIALRCSEADSRVILADDNPAARLLSRPGEAIYNADQGRVEGNYQFQVSWLSEEEHDRYLAALRSKGHALPAAERRAPIVFEGNEPAEVESNQLLARVLHAPEWPAPARAVPAWVGDPIAIRDPVAARFRRQSGSNLLVVGQSEDLSLSVLTAALISLCAHTPLRAGTQERDHPQFYVLDFGSVDGPNAEYFQGLAALLPHGIQLGRRRELPQIVDALAATVVRRLEHDGASSAGRAPADSEPLYLFVYGLHRARDLRPDDSAGFPSLSSSYGEPPPPPSPAQQFSTILRDGPDVGVHTLVWCDSVANLNRSVDRRTLREFALRIVFQMSADDSANLVDSTAASKLGPHRALYYSEDEGLLEKLRPYGLPSAEWLSWAGAQLHRKAESPLAPS